MLAGLLQALQQCLTGDDWAASEFREGYARAQRGERSSEDCLERYDPFRAVERREVRERGFKVGHLEKTLHDKVQELREDLR